MKQIIKKTIYYIILTIAFILLPIGIRNIYLSILLKENIISIIINAISSAFIFIYPLSIALIIIYNLKHNKWPISFIYDEGKE